MVLLFCYCKTIKAVSQSHLRKITKVSQPVLCGFICQFCWAAQSADESSAGRLRPADLFYRLRAILKSRRLLA